MQRSARVNFDPEALSPTEVELLLLVAERPGIGVAVAASELGAAPNTVSTLIRKLVTVGLLHREFSRGDRRVARLLLTDEATSRLERWRGRRADVLTDALGQLDPNQQQLLGDALPLLDILSTSLYQPRRRSRGKSTSGSDTSGDDDEPEAEPHRYRSAREGTATSAGPKDTGLESVQAERADWAISTSHDIAPGFQTAPRPLPVSVPHQPNEGGRSY